MEKVVVIANNLRTGTHILFQGNVYVVLEYQHVKPGKGGAFMKTKIKNIQTGEIISHTFRSDERVEQVIIEEVKVQYLYRTGNSFHFMDMETFEEFSMEKEKLGDKIQFLKENSEVVLLKSGEEIITLQLPNFIELRVKETPPGVKGDTVSGGSKPATLETGAVIQVPLFIKPGDVVRVDTRTGKYVERA